MNRVLVKVMALLAVAAFITAALSQITAGAEEPQARVNTVTVCGEARVRYKNDTAIINIGVETNHKNSNEALKANSEKMDAVIAAIKGKGITDAEISTNNISVYPRYDYVYGTSVLKDYTVQNMIRVRTQNMAILGDIMTAAGEAGANQMNGIEFLLNNPNNIKLDALAQAVKNAEFKAQVAAGSTGIPLGNVVSIREHFNISPVYAAYDSASMYKSSAGSVPAISGDGEMYARVEVVYNLY